MDLYGDYLQKVQGKSASSGSSTDTTKKTSGWAKFQSSSMFKPASLSRSGQAMRKAGVKTGAGAKAATGARGTAPASSSPSNASGGRPKAATVTAFRPPQLVKKSLPSPTLKPAKGPTVPPMQVSTQSTRDAFDQHMVDEYDPSQPNDYEAFVEERERAKKKAARERQLKREVEENERERKRMREERDEQARQVLAGNASALEGVGIGSGGRGAGRGMGRGRGRGMTMPAWMTRGLAQAKPADAEAGKADGASSSEQPSDAGSGSQGRDTGRFASADGADAGGSRDASSDSGKPVGSNANMSFAERMMAKMGHKKGQGLGKHGTGITSALRHTKTGVKSGKIIAPKQRANRPERPPPSRVVMLANMVAPGAVDDDLQAETQDECSRFGPVREVVVNEAPAGSVPDEEAVRIFVEFEKPQSAVDALSAMGGRFFDGRRVTATLYPEDRFRARDFGR